MKIVPIAGPSSREYPHLITRGARSNQRWRLDFATPTVGIAAHAFPHDLLDEHGRPTPEGRRAVLERFSRIARGSAARHCVVWSADECTWIDGRGRARDGRNPPEGIPVAPREMNSTPARPEHAWTIRLPAGCTHSHLSVRMIARGYVEIAPAGPMLLGHFDEPLEEGEDDPAAGMTDGLGIVAAPKTWRGQPVTGIVDGWTLTGPVQPCSDGVVMRNPWPDALAAACDRIAGRPLSDRIHDAAWRVYDPENKGMIFVGVLEAA